VVGRRNARNHKQIEIERTVLKELPERRTTITKRSGSSHRAAASR
jgi:hypothetical protein